MGYIGEGINQTATSVETAKDEFFGTYYGQISSDPTVDPNGEAITDGDLFYNTSEEALKIRVNGEWLSLRTATTGYQQFTATAGQTTFNVAGSFSPGFVFVTLNGVVLASGDYNDSSGTSIVLTSGAASGDILGVYLFDTFSVADTVSASAGGSFSGPVDFSDNINVDSGTLFVDSANNQIDINGTIKAGPFGPVSGTAGSVALGLAQSDTGFFRPSFNTIGISTNASEAARIDSSGNVGIGTTSPSEKLEVNGNIIADGVYLGGTGSANKLDDYEEGTWTPVFIGSTSGSKNLGSIGTYIKVGGLVIVSFHMAGVDFSSVGISGTVGVVGLPFGLADNTQWLGTTALNNLISGASDIIPYGRTGNEIRFSVGGSTSNLSDSGLTQSTNRFLALTFTYRTNS